MLYWLKGCIPAVRRREAMRSVAVTRETILQELEGLPEDQLREVLEFIFFLKFRREMERARQRFAVAVKEARAIAQERGITDEEVLAEIRAVRAKQ
jgi:hypothetical protein